MKNKTFIQSIKCAIFGICYAFKTEKNYKYYCVIFIINVIINILLQMNYICYIVNISLAAGAFSAECINTSIEHLADMETQEIKPEIKIIKDVAASSVLCWGVAYFSTEIIMILMEII